MNVFETSLILRWVSYSLVFGGPGNRLEGKHTLVVPPFKSVEENSTKERLGKLILILTKVLELIVEDSQYKSLSTVT